MFSNVTNPNMKREVEGNIISHYHSQSSSAFHRTVPFNEGVGTDYLMACTAVLKHTNILQIYIHCVGRLPGVG